MIAGNLRGNFSTCCLLLAMLLLHPAAGQNSTQEQLSNARRTLSIGYIVFPGFTPLDIFGPLEMFFQLSYTYKISLSIISHAKGPVSARSPPHRMDASLPPDDYSFMLGPSIMATHTFEDAPPLDIILVPGGLGNIALIQANDTKIEDFLARRFDAVDYILSVCIGSVSLARAGLLAGRKATTNKSAWQWATNYGTNVTWVPTARWVQDGKIWTSSGVAAGIDMTYAFLRHIYPAEKIDEMINGIEYAPHTDPHWDPFAAVHGVPGANKNQSLTDCVVPAGHGK